MVRRSPAGKPPEPFLALTRRGAQSGSVASAAAAEQPSPLQVDWVSSRPAHCGDTFSSDWAAIGCRRAREESPGSCSSRAKRGRRLLSREVGIGRRDGIGRVGRGGALAASLRPPASRLAGFLESAGANGSGRESGSSQFWARWRESRLGAVTVHAKNVS